MSSQLGVLAPKPEPGTQGRTLIPIDLDAVRYLSSMRLSEGAIAAQLGISQDTFTKRKKQYPEVQQALDAGVSDAQKRLAELIDTNLEKSPVERIFAAKQPTEKGGLGWADKLEHHYSGQITHRVEMPALDEWRQARLEGNQPEVIDAEYEVID